MSSKLLLLLLSSTTLNAWIDSNVRIRTPTDVDTMRHVLSRLNVIELTIGRSVDSDRILQDELLFDEVLVVVSATATLLPADASFVVSATASLLISLTDDIATS